MVVLDNDCVDCERLVNVRQENSIKFPTYYNRPVLANGYEKTKLLIVGLAPGLHGANATGLPNENHYTTVKDLSILTSNLIKQ